MKLWFDIEIHYNDYIGITESVLVLNKVYWYCKLTIGWWNELSSGYKNKKYYIIQWRVIFEMSYAITTRKTIFLRRICGRRNYFRGIHTIQDRISVTMKMCYHAKNIQIRYPRDVILCERKTQMIGILCIIFLRKSHFYVEKKNVCETKSYKLSTWTCMASPYYNLYFIILFITLF